MWRNFFSKKIRKPQSKTASTRVYSYIHLRSGNSHQLIALRHDSAPRRWLHLLATRQGWRLLTALLPFNRWQKVRMWVVERSC